MHARGRGPRTRFPAALLIAAGLALTACDETPTDPAVPDEGIAVNAAARTEQSPWTTSSLGTLPGDLNATALAVNDAGVAVGWSEGSNGLAKPFLHANGTATALAEAGVHGYATAISNGAPLFVGGRIDDDSDQRPVRWTVTLGSSGPVISREIVDATGTVRGVNDAGDLAGSGAGGWPVIWHAGGGRTVIAPPAGTAFTGGGARDINNGGLVALVFTGPDADIGYLRLAGGALIRLPPAPGDASSYAGGVSERRADGTVFVAGTTWRNEDVWHPVRWTVDASSGTILSTRVMRENGSVGSVSQAGELAGGLEKNWRDRPALWSDSGIVKLPIPTRTSFGFAWAISPGGGYAVGHADNTSSGGSAVLWTRAP